MIEQVLEYGKRMKDPAFREMVNRLPIDYQSIYGMGIPEVVPHMRRWILTKVKPNSESKFPQCLIVYDYIKLATVNELKGGKLAEWQVHGLNVAALHDFCNKYHIPILAFGQTNRELDTDFNCVAGAKRIVENVTSISLLKAKTENEYALDPNGTHLIRVFAARYGRATPNSYINFHVNLECGEFEERELGTVNFAEIRQQQNRNYARRREQDGEAED